ncbi:hypothetical protein SB461_33175, partial [Burkholderia cenocepacia]|uniref:hypothetical protein n=1 Tax=Burkholderia cenocepacia TaxID=95486 RepID=UPI002B241B4E
GCGNNDIVCSSNNVGCSFPDEAFLSGYLTDTNKYSSYNFLDFLEFFDRKCLREEGSDKINQTIDYTWIGSNALGVKIDSCKNVFCFGDDVPTNVVYHGWYYNSETDKNLNPYWSWDCADANAKYGSKLTCGAKEMGCAPHFDKGGATDDRFVDSLVNK